MRVPVHVHGYEHGQGQGPLHETRRTRRAEGTGLVEQLGPFALLDGFGERLVERILVAREQQSQREPDEKK